MRKSIFYLAFMALMAVGCQQELEQDNPSGNLSKVMFTAVTESSADVKTSLNPSVDDEKIYNIHWSAGDEVLVSDGNVSAEFVTVLTDDPTYAGLATYAQENVPAEGAENYYAVFPSCDGASAGSDGYTVVIPAIQTWEKGEFDMPMVGRGGSDNKISFMNAASILKITPNNLCDSYDGVRVARIEVSAASDIAGKVAVTYDGTDEPSFGIVEEGSNTITLDCGAEGAEFSETFYIALVPGSYESLTIMITSNGGGSQTFTLTTPEGKSYERSEYASVGVKISNLAIYETANCYLIKRPGTYKFPVNVRGNGSASILRRTSTSSSEYVSYTYPNVNIDVDGISSVSTSVISQQDKTVADHDASLTLQNVRREGDYVYFTVPENFVPGNIRIGIHGSDASKYTWSWHIWVNDQVEDVDIGNLHNNIPYRTKLMNMNLGSLQTKENLAEYAEGNSGLYYQWGRKDPFPPMNGSDVKMPEGFTVDEHCNGNTAAHKRSKMENSINYPADFYSGHAINDQIRTWCDESLHHHWAAALCSGNAASYTTYTYEKSMFDPCPPGYRIMDPFTAKKIAYDGGPKTYSMTNYEEYMQTNRVGKPVFPYDGYRTPGTCETVDGKKQSNYEIAGDLADTGAKPYYWIASTWKDDNLNAAMIMITNITIESTVNQWANLQKQVKSRAASIRPIRDSQ